MSVWRLEIDMAFKEEGDMKSFLNLIDEMYDKLAEKQTGQLPINQKVRYHQCMHDSGQPCSGYVTFDFDGEKAFPEANSEDIIPVSAKLRIEEAAVLKASEIKIEEK